jgi:hypothetical protein
MRAYDDEVATPRVGTLVERFRFPRGMMPL